MYFFLCVFFVLTILYDTSSLFSLLYCGHFDVYFYNLLSY